MSRTNETCRITRCETCPCKCRLGARICNDKRRWYSDKCSCECKELTDERRYHNWFVWNANICENECKKLCDAAKYLDYANCKCRKRLIDKLVEKCEKLVLYATHSIPNHNVHNNYRY